MDLSEAIAAARAFSLYFQLINILEQRIEEDSYLDSLRPSWSRNRMPAITSIPSHPLASQTDPATFGDFERLRRMNVPPGQVENLLQELDIRLVFTAHPPRSSATRPSQTGVWRICCNGCSRRCRSPVRTRTICVASWRKRSGCGGAPTSCISSSRRFWMRWTRPSITSSRCCSQRCPSCDGASRQP